MNLKFIMSKADLDWSDIVWGYEHHLLGWKDVVYYANEQVIHGSDIESVIELSMINKSTISDLADLLKNSAKDLDDYNPAKWIYLILFDLFNHRNESDDPLGEVEKIYEQFDYPEEIESFVRYMPVKGDYDPREHTNEENMNRLYNSWESYLKNNQLVFLR